jgi:hypothetical protein
MDLGVSGQLYRTGGVYWLIYQTPAAGTGQAHASRLARAKH